MGTVAALAVPTTPRLDGDSVGGHQGEHEHHGDQTYASPSGGA